jgi:hypothetical protein
MTKFFTGANRNNTASAPAHANTIVAVCASTGIVLGRYNPEWARVGWSFDVAEVAAIEALAPGESFVSVGGGVRFTRPT